VIENPRETSSAVDRSFEAAGTGASEAGTGISIIYPCLNEERAIGDCVRRAQRVLKQCGMPGEVVVVDNDSSDRSAEVAASAGARVVTEQRRGYGSAYLRGFREARGQYLVLLDGDGTYPVEMTGQFVEHLRSGADLVCGNRFSGLMEPGAMPWMNRYIGNPLLSALTRLLFRLPVRDIHCGMRALRRPAMERLQLATTGMEFATEMIVKAIDNGLKIHEVSIPYRPRIGDSKLSPFSDAWRHVEYMLVFSPSVLFLWPGFVLLTVGLLVQLLLLWGPRTFWFHTWDVHTNVFGLAATLIGSTLLVMGLVGAAFGATVGMRFRHSPLARRLSAAGDLPLRRIGVVAAACGAAIWGVVTIRWAASDFGTLQAIPVLTLGTSFLAGGLELIAAAFLVHLIRVQRA
jgi:glycosyltransferase involved in cell wall biosynthesis